MGAYVAAWRGDRGVKERVGHSASDFRKGAPHRSLAERDSGGANLETWGWRG